MPGEPQEFHFTSRGSDLTAPLSCTVPALGSVAAILVLYLRHLDLCMGRMWPMTAERELMVFPKNPLTVCLLTLGLGFQSS